MFTTAAQMKVPSILARALLKHKRLFSSNDPFLTYPGKVADIDINIVMITLSM